MFINLTKNKEKAINKLLKKAEIVKSSQIELNESDFIDLELNDFLNMSGDLFFDKDHDSFYKRNNQKWFRYKSIRKQNIIEDKNSSIKALEQWIIHLNKKIEKLECQQNEFFNSIKNYVDLKLDGREI